MVHPVNMLLDVRHVANINIMLQNISLDQAWPTPEKLRLFQDHELRQLLVSTNYLNVSTLCHGMEEDPNCHPQRR